MGIGIIDEVERGKCGVPRLDMDMLESEEKKERPEEVEESGGGNRGAERALRSDGFGGERDGIMSDEHVKTSGDDSTRGSSEYTNGGEINQR